MLLTVLILTFPLPFSLTFSDVLVRTERNFLTDLSLKQRNLRTVERQYSNGNGPVERRLYTVRVRYRLTCIRIAKCPAPSSVRLYKTPMYAAMRVLHQYCYMAIVTMTAGAGGDTTDRTAWRVRRSRFMTLIISSIRNGPLTGICSNFDVAFSFFAYVHRFQHFTLIYETSYYQKEYSWSFLLPRVELSKV